MFGRVDSHTVRLRLYLLRLELGWVGGWGDDNCRGLSAVVTLCHRATLHSPAFIEFERGKRRDDAMLARRAVHLFSLTCTPSAQSSATPLLLPPVTFRCVQLVKLLRIPMTCRHFTRPPKEATETRLGRQPTRLPRLRLTAT